MPSRSSRQRQPTAACERSTKPFKEHRMAGSLVMRTGLFVVLLQAR